MLAIPRSGDGVSRPEHIAFLLTHLEDVRAGLRDRGQGGEHIPLMCRAWNHPSYRQLERLLPLLRGAHPELASALARTFFAPKRRMLVCPRCDVRPEVWSSARFHKHGRKSVALVPRVLRVVPLEVRGELVAEAISWLDERWQGGVFVPDELLPLVEAA